MPVNSLAGAVPQRASVFHEGAPEETYQRVLHSTTALLSGTWIFREVSDGAARYVGSDDVTGFVAAVRCLEGLEQRRPAHGRPANRRPAPSVTTRPARCSTCCSPWGTFRLP